MTSHVNEKLPGRECLAAELHNKANNNPNDFVPNKVFFPSFIARQVENYESRCLSFKGHCKKKLNETISSVLQLNRRDKYLERVLYGVCSSDVVKATKGFILIRHKRYSIYICLQLSSSIASFVWKPAHFKFRSYGGA